MYRIILHDGTILNGLTLNGNNFISETIIQNTIFENNLKTVTIEGDDYNGSFADMVLVANRIYEGKSWFILAEKTEQQKKEEAYQKRIAELEDALLSTVSYSELAAAIQEGVDSV